MVASNLKTFLGYRIFQSDKVSRSLAAVSVLVTFEIKTSIFDVVKKYMIIKSIGVFRTQ